MDRPLISVTRVDLKRLSAACERIADALELYLRYHAIADPPPEGEMVEVSHTDREMIGKHELLEVLERDGIPLPAANREEFFKMPMDMILEKLEPYRKEE